ncbi:hypothetical protein [Mycobacterium shimoidei]|uniref:PE-PPE domain-containing protein n=1 Tax=Mycobacterium shimoidei TaxID=29313 RepID=A0A1E3TG77_MYCSH|nr:hypothetical protein [Mycobacterium shimoidei]MCV7260378.1 hypothetical protein [Mycobacterium shimoidei]ODR12989.1 hypothetical protein BHQ16_13075 [Mycobacterium shimoidei]ORW82136.1 hypothetical protein AWC26_05650 [Mycobacterium shimoidei]SRX95449.1 hypothetical protein MSP7336_03718 [Mycobacterium shimoidei]
MQIARPYALAAAALAATGTVAVTPLASRLPEIPVTSRAVSLVDSSILNVPINVLYDLANIPYNEVQALNSVAGSLFFSGNWWVPSSTNLWGIDPGDPTHVALITDFFPFPAFNEGVGGLQYQIDGLLAAELPVNASCDAETCAPMTPPDFITGSTVIDRDIGFIRAITGQANFGLFENWFRVPISDLINGYTFNPVDDPGAIDPSGPVNSNPIFGFPGVDQGGDNPFEGGTGPGDEMPWNGHTYTLNLFQPFVNYWEHLMETPPTDGDIPGTGIMIPTATEFFQALQAVAAGMIVDFYPWVPGSPACPAECDSLLSVPQLVALLDPTNSNPMIQAWLEDTANGTANNATPDQINAAVALLQTGTYNLNPEQLDQLLENLASINPALPALGVNLGLYTDPGYLAYALDPQVGFNPVYGGYNPNLVGQDLLDAINSPTDWSKLLDINLMGEILFPAASNWTAMQMDPAAAALNDANVGVDLGNLTELLGTGSLTDMLNSLAAELTAQLQEDLSALASSFGADLPADFMSALPDLLAVF